MGLTEYIMKSRSGVYKDTPENRRLHRVGQRYGESEAKREEREAYEKRRDAAHREESERQYVKAKELLSALEKRGLKGFYISRSVKDWGVSTYVQGEGQKFRISDHDVVNTDRVLNETHFSHNSDVDKLADNALREYQERMKRAEERRKVFNEKKAEEESLDSYWDTIKDRFKGKVFKKNARTYQTPEEFKNKGSEPRTDIFVKKLDRGAYAYEWAEPTTYNRWGRPENYGSEKPSIEWLRWHREANG